MSIIKADSNKIETISDYISEVVHSYEDNSMFEGAYITSSVNHRKLSSVVLHLVYIDYQFRKEYSKEDLEKASSETGVNISIVSTPYWKIGHNVYGKLTEPYATDLLNGHIIFDRQGNLTEMQRLFRLAHSNEVDEVIIEPPIQYKKTKQLT